MKNKIIKLVIIIIVSTFFSIFAYGMGKSEVEASWESYNISGIDESKYPNYKASLQAIQESHPNWKIKVLYTGLNWEDVINGEYTGHFSSPSSLIQNTYSGEWICPICEKQTYDVSHNWYCASKEAIEYMMDPRNSLTENYIFQFQDLASSSGERESIQKMVSNTYLNQTSYINAIMEAATENSISPYHIVARLKQEQGSSGTGIMNGYIYTTDSGERVKVYNLYNIGVSGNGIEGVINGAKIAYNNQWFTPEASIKGGAKYLKEKYIDKGQTTLYFQKFNVVDTNNLYKNQYMQNIRGANDEGNTIYNAYKNNGILNGTFEFTIPIYENMPTTPCASPLNETDKYQGDITSQITQLNVNKNSSGAQYISGQIIIVEWINGKSTVPRTIPKITLESADGTIEKEIFVKQISGNTYYFDVYINTLDKTRKYKIVAQLTEGVNISQNKSMTVKLTDTKFSNSECYILNNFLYIGTYEGGLTHQLYDISLSKTETGLNYIMGTLMAIEWVNEQSTVPSELPKMTLESTDGTVKREMFVKYNSRNDYYFDIFVEELDLSKNYQINMELIQDNNVSKYKKKVIELPNKTLGTLKNREMSIENNIIQFAYEGEIQNNIQAINLNKISNTSYYISGTVKIIEIIDNKENTLQTLPKLTLKSTDGTITKNMYIKQNGENIYYFDCYIDGLDKNKEYEIYGQLTDLNNKGTNKEAIVKIPNQTLGDNGKIDIIINNNKLKFQYSGSLTNQLIDLQLNETSNGKYYISGNIVAIEWVKGKSTVPEDLPKITLVSEDEKVILEVFVNSNGTNTYYFDKYIDNIDVNKKYKLKIELTTNFNTSTQKTNTVQLENKELGSYNKYYNVQTNNNYIIFKDSSYVGNINSELKEIKLGVANNEAYLSGKIIVVEWVNGKSTVPKVAPKMRFKSTDGTVNMDVFVTATGTNTYYFDRFIEGIDTSKEYVFEIASADEKNISESKSMNVYFSGTRYDNSILGTYRNKQIQLVKQNMKFI